MNLGILHVLVIDRTDIDAAPALEALRREGYELEWERTASLAGCEQAIVDGDYDVLLSELQLDGYEVAHVLRLIRENHLDVPVIVVTGAAGEDQGQAIRAGARDIVTKEGLSRLGPVVARELADVRARRLRRGAEAELEAQHRRFQALLSNSVEAIGVLDSDGTTLYSSPSCGNVIGFTPEELAGRNAFEFVAVEDRPEAEAALRRIREKPGAIERIVVRIRHRNGSDFWGEICGLNRLDDPAIRGVVINYHDVSERVHQERQIRRLNRVYAALLEFNRKLAEAKSGADACQAACETLRWPSVFRVVCIRRLDSSSGALVPVATAGEAIEAVRGVPVFADDRAEGTGPSGMAARFGRTHVCNDIDSDPIAPALQTAMRRLGIVAAIAIPISLEGGERGVLTVYAGERGVFGAEEVDLLEGAAAELSRAIAHLSDVAARLTAEQRIREQAELLDKANEAIVVTGVDGRITFWNHGAERVFGRVAAAATGRRYIEVLESLGVDAHADGYVAAAGEADWRGEMRGRRVSGQPFVLDVGITALRGQHGGRTGLLIVSTDITEKKQVEEQFLRTQRLDSIGMLAAGISHDMNNVLAPVGMVASILRAQARDPVELRLLDTLENCAQRGAGLVRQIVAFANGEGSEFSLIQPKHILREVAGIVAETFPRSITLEDFIPSDLWPVDANPTQLHQVMLNLCVNARDAMPDGGTLTLRAENLHLSAEQAAQFEGASAGAWIALHVEDTGTGIPPEIAERVWEPFFTRKPKGRGNGLGLSTARQIVKNHHGFIYFTSVSGQGTAFHVYLPAVQASAVCDVHAAPPSVGGGGELMLVVDDEEPVLQSAAAVLDQAGYRVLTARNGTEAVTVVAQHAAELALLVTDIDMPSLGGADLAKVVTTIRPDLKVLAISGLTGLGAAKPDFAAHFLQKPFTGVQLLAAVELLLRGTPIPPSVFEGPR